MICKTYVCINWLSVLSVCTVCNVDVLWPNSWMDQGATWHGGTEVGIGPGHIVLDGDPAPSSKGHSPSPQFSAHICCGPVNSSHGQLVTRSSRHTINSSPVNSSHNTDRICIPEKNHTSVSAGLQIMDVNIEFFPNPDISFENPV